MIDKDLFDKAYTLGKFSEKISSTTCCDAGVYSLTEDRIVFPFRVVLKYDKYSANDIWEIRDVVLTHEEFINLSFEEIMDRFGIVIDELTQIYDNWNDRKTKNA